LNVLKQQAYLLDVGSVLVLSFQLEASLLIYLLVRKYL
jgi:hypothetical protein